MNKFNKCSTNCNSVPIPIKKENSLTKCLKTYNPIESPPNSFLIKLEERLDYHKQNISLSMYSSKCTNA